MLTKSGNDRGISTIVAIMMMVMLTMIGIAAVKLSNDEVSIAGSERNEMQAFYAAEAGLEKVSAALQASYEVTNQPPAVMPSGTETINDCVVTYNTIAPVAPEQKPLTLGTLAGLNALIRTFTITATAISSIDQSQVVLKQDFECALVPIFQFAVFYGNDLEIAPGPDMNLIGRVHTNGDLYLQAGSNLYMDSYVTSSGDIHHGRKGPGGVDYGGVYIKDTEGSYQNMLSGGTALDSNDPNWYDSASARWGGRVQDEAFGQSELHLPLSVSGDPHKILERAPGNPDSYENVADMRIINGGAEIRSGGSWMNVSGLLPVGTITTSSFYDMHEGEWVTSTDIDMALLTGSAYFPTNGVVYVSKQTGSSLNGTRLVNGSEIYQAVSVFSENPVYVQGDYNTINKKPAAVAGDAVTFLSNNWADSNSTKVINDRQATATSVNASIMTGNTNTSASNYNGGLENLPRFLERWSGIDFNYKGSMVNLWNSQEADGLWSYGTYYTAPNRNWSYDTDLDDPNNLPPETPLVRVFQRIGWKQENVGFYL